MEVGSKDAFNDGSEEGSPDRLKYGYVDSFDNVIIDGLAEGVKDGFNDGSFKEWYRDRVSGSRSN